MTEMNYAKKNVFFEIMKNKTTKKMNKTVWAIRENEATS